MKNENEKLGKFESVTTIIVNIGQIISWVITLVTALALVTQPIPITFTGVFELGKPYAITFLISVLFGYIQLLRHFWRRSRTKKIEVESSFGSYLYGSIVKLKRPLVSIGFVIIFIVIYQVEPAGFSAFIVLCLIIVGATVFTLLDDSPVSIKKHFWRLDDEFHKRWLKRVRNQLHSSGYVFTSDFNNLGIDSDEVNWAIENYFNSYEFDQDLILTKHFYEEVFKSKVFLELRFNHLPTRLKKSDTT